VGGDDVAQRQSALVACAQWTFSTICQQIELAGTGTGRPGHRARGQVELTQRMLAKTFGQRGKGQGLEEKWQPGAWRVCSVVIQVFTHCAVEALQAAQPGFGRLFQQAPGLNRFAALRLHHQHIPLVQHLVRRAAQHTWQLSAHRGGFGARQVRAVHAAGAAVEVVRLVHQHTDAPAVELGQSVKHGAAVKVVVVVTHHHIRPAHHLMAQVIGAHRMLQRDRAQALLVQPAALRRRVPGLGQAVVKTLGQGAGLAVAGLVFVLARFVFGHQFQHPQRQATVCASRTVCKASSATHAPGRLGGQEKQLVDAHAQAWRAAQETLCRWSCQYRWAPAPAACGTAHRPCTHHRPNRAGRV
jgi:hypothetical protein